MKEINIVENMENNLSLEDIERDEPIRIQKYFTDCGVLSRRAAEAEIAAGHVKINGVVAEIGQKIIPGQDEVIWNGSPVLPPKKTEHVTVMLHKPAGFVTTTSDEQGRPCVTDLLQELNVRLYPVGRLDMNSTGLLLLTNDGELANLLTHPSHHIPKVYHVAVGGEITDSQLRRLSSPMVIDGYRIKPVKVNLLKAYEHMSEMEMTLYEGRNRQIRKMCAQLDLHLLWLKRVSMGPLSLGHLAEGKFRYLGPGEVAALKHAAIMAGKENVRPKPQKPRIQTMKKPTGNPRRTNTKEK